MTVVCIMLTTVTHSCRRPREDNNHETVDENVPSIIKISSVFLGQHADVSYLSPAFCFRCQLDLRYRWHRSPQSTRPNPCIARTPTWVQVWICRTGRLQFTFWNGLGGYDFESALVECGAMLMVHSWIYRCLIICFVVLLLSRL